MSDLESGWSPLTGQRAFKSAREAWLVYGQYRFSVSERTFYSRVGKGKDCPPGPDGLFHVEDIEIIAQVRAWPPAPAFVVGVRQGGEGEAAELDLDVGAEFQLERLKRARFETQLAELEVKRKLKEVLPRAVFEERMAAAAAVVGNEAEVFVYDNVREIIELCGGKAEKEVDLREFLLGKVRGWLHAFSLPANYIVEFEASAEDTEG